MTIRHVFVYGSLRPDDDSGQAWTKEAVNGLTAQKARLPKAQLFRDKYRYAYAVLDDSSPSSRNTAVTSSTDNNDSGSSSSISNNDTKSNNNNHHFILGYVLSTTDETLFKKKLELFDSIDGFRGANSSNNFFERAVVDVELISNSYYNGKEEDVEGKKGEIVQAYVYHGQNNHNRLTPISSGDWLQRDRSKE